MKLAHPRHPLSDEMERKVGLVIGRSDAISPWDARPTIGASIIRIVVWGSLYYNYNKEPPK